MEGKQNKQKGSKKNKENDAVEHDERSISSTPTLARDDPAKKKASEGENETVSENKNKKHDDEPTQEIEGKRDKKRYKKGMNEQPDSETIAGGDDPAKKKAREGENETVSEDKNKKYDGESTQEVDDKPDKKRYKKTGEQKGQQEEQNPMYIFVILVPILIIGASSIFLDTPSTTDDINIEERLEQLANDFQNQSPGSFKKLRSRVMPYIHHATSPQPFVLLVASTHENQLTAECFATRVAKLFATSSVTINGSNYWAAVSDDAKNDIDSRLRNVFSEGKFPTAAVIHDLDLIPYGTTNLFYAYCDHDNPMYKEAAIIFTITLPQSYQISDDEVDRESLVEMYLSEHSPWVKDQNFSIDIMGALISRITDTVIVVNKESSESLQNSC